MNLSWILAVIAVLLLAATVTMLMMRARAIAGPAEADALRFRHKPLLTLNEQEFLQRLEAALPEYRIFAQVAMGALLEPAVPRSDAQAYHRLRGMVAQKIVDFVAYDRRGGKVIAVIELDDRTHDEARDAKRDALLAAAGLRTVRWNSKAKPDPAAIRQQLLMPATGTSGAPRSSGAHR